MIKLAKPCMNAHSLHPAVIGFWYQPQAVEIKVAKQGTEPQISHADGLG